MLNLNKRITFPFILAAMAIMAIFFIAYSVRWLDKQPWISYPENKFLVKVLPHVYLMYPFSSKDDDIRRTLKLAHFIALSEVNSTSLEKTLLSFNKAQQLIESFLLDRSDQLHGQDMSELVLERLILLNRMGSIILSSKKHIPQIVEKATDDARNLLDTISDIEVKRALQREISLYAAAQQEINAENPNMDDLFDLVDMFYYGLGRCAVNDETGAPLINSSLAMIPKGNLIFLISRNIDLPLIAVVSENGGPACALAAQSITRKLKD